MNISLALKGRVLNGLGETPIEDGVVLVSGMNIVGVGRADEINVPQGVEVIEGNTIMPGMIDCHMHYWINGEPDLMEVASNSTMSTFAIKAAVYARRDLEAGYTTVRSLSNPEFLDISLRDAIKQGIIAGPRVLTAGRAIKITGGHGTFYKPWIHSDIRHGIDADGVEEVRKAVRQNVRAGVDWIKLFATGGVLDYTTTIGSRNFNYDEIRVAVEEAEKLGRRVAVHTVGLEGALDCIRAGVSTIEHGIGLDDEACEMMKEKGITLIPTLSALDNIVHHGIAGGIREYAVTKAEKVYEQHLMSFKKACKHGVKIAMGTDTGAPFSFHGANARELELMVGCGMSPMDAVIATTKNAADAVGLGDDVGTLEIDKLADILVVDGDPLKDITILQNKDAIKVVLKEGEKAVQRS